MTNLAKQKILRQRVQAKFPFLLEITHEDFGSFYYVNCDDNITYDGHEYIASVFKFSPPDIQMGKIGNASLEFSAIYNNREWIKKIRTTDKCAYLRIVASIIYVENSIEGIEPIYDLEFSMKNVTWDEQNLRWDLIFDEGMNLNFPCDKLDEINCPALV